MSNQKPLIIWDEVALTELEEIGEYFEKEVQSIQSAKKVVKTIKIPFLHFQTILKFS